MPLKSFVAVAPDSHFPLENLPFGVFQPKQGGPRAGVAIGDLIADLSALDELGHFQAPEFRGQRVFSEESLNAFLALGRPAWRKTREILQHLLAADTPILRDDPVIRARVFHAQKEVAMKLPARIGNYTDFYSSYHHAHNVGTMLRGPENALMPNWKWLPVAYHGRASSIVVSGTDVRRPNGQIKPPDAQVPSFGPTKSLDYELEMAFLVGPGNPLGEPISIDRATDHIFGFVLMNDWSARDIQAWEYQPLGPFLAKNFATSISPWIVTLEALEAFRKPLPQQDPEPLPYLRSKNDSTFDINLEARLDTSSMSAPHVITRTNFQNLYWSIAQQLAHHTISGCNLQPGDLLASGTISGPTEESRGCMLELTWRGANPLKLPNDETRKWLENGDTLSITGWCQGDGYRVGFGEVSGRIIGSDK
ncbi:MAG TPA: fumarylacetoacetase [Candidatus Udaeobacter sp.]|jgi:fumarylacetoacetase|nr:fumarylacetoacetase [Candidatus Udaeobacter sp.]